MVYKRSITTNIVFLLRHNGVQEVNNNKYCIPPQTQWCTRGQYKTNIFDWQLMVSKTDIIYTHTNHVNLKNIIRIRSWKQSVYIWHINQNIWEVDTSFKRAICLFLEDLTLYPSSTVCYPRQHFIFEFYPLKLFYFAGMIFVGSSIKEIIHFILIWQKTWLPWAFLVSDWLKL
jgi:hypothetical protein